VTVENKGKVVLDYKGDLSLDRDRRGLCNRIHEHFGGDKKTILKRIENFSAKARNERRQKQNGKPHGTNDIRAQVLDGAASVIRRPLCLLEGHAYAATYLNVQTTTHQTVDPKTGEVTNYDPPLVKNVPILAVIRDDGKLFADGAPIAGAQTLTKLGLEVSLPTPFPADRAWSGAGVKCFLAGKRPDAASVFERVKSVVNTFMDFSRSLKIDEQSEAQEILSELTACYILATYFLDAFYVAGYLWPNGEKGSGKTNYLVVVTELGYLGLVVLAAGSYASLRDLADYGATIAFDDAEAVTDIRKSDPDKRALLLAGNRRGTTVPVKEPAPERGWLMRHLHVFSFRLFSAIRLPDDVLASRSIIVPLVRSGDEERAKRNPQDPSLWPCDRRTLLDDLWAMGVAYLHQIPECDTKAAKAAHLHGRDLEPWRAILAVAWWLQVKHGVEGIHDRIERLSKAYQEERSDLEDRDPIRVAIRGFGAMARVHQHASAHEFEFATSELAEFMNNFAKAQDLVAEDKTFTNSRKVGWLLKRLRFRKAPNKRTRYWKTSVPELMALARAYGMSLEPEEDEKTCAQSPKPHKQNDGNV
jgi:hypothetical protein